MALLDRSNAVVDDAIIDSGGSGKDPESVQEPLAGSIRLPPFCWVFRPPFFDLTIYALYANKYA
jgi:hypothetical protein